MSKTVYLCSYDETGLRNVSPAASTMAKYVFNTISSVTDNFTVISAAQTKDNKELQREEISLENGKLIYLPSEAKESRKNYIGRLVRRVRYLNNFRKELESQINDGDTLIVYHSPNFIKPVLQLRKKKNFKLILQVCEIYADVSGDEALRKKELSFIKTADAYIFATQLLEQKLNNDNKNYAVCLGTYTLNDFCKERSNDDSVIHCVYAGTLDPRKGGAGAAVAATALLPSNYHIHILGFGSREEIDNIKKLIADVSEKSQAKVSYDGVLLGDDYLRFIANCDIGLSTQNPNASFNATSFPSKILSYMASGLRVVSIRIPAIEKSEVGGLMYYYDEQTPENIAKAILSVDINDDYNGQESIKKLDENFRQNVKQLIATL